MEFQIRMRTVNDVRDFVALATARPFQIMVGNEHHQVNGKCFMEMFCLNLRQPLKVTCQCSEGASQEFSQDIERFLVK